jgi:hypothetical protein
MIVVCLLFALFLLSQVRRPARRRAFAVASLVLFVVVVAGIAGCSGGSSGTVGGGAKTRSITAVYGGDANYAGSTSAAVSITIQ